MTARGPVVLLLSPVIRAARGRRDGPVAVLQNICLQLHPATHAPVAESHKLWLTQLVMRVGGASIWMGGQGDGWVSGCVTGWIGGVGVRCDRCCG